MNSDRQYAVATALFHYLKSPSLRHLRDPHSVQTLAREIVRSLDGASSIWKKWDGDREEIVKAACHCWIPAADLQDFLNTLPGPILTKTDVEQRLRALWEEPYTPYPKDELKEGCSALYASEKADGTEMRAIIGALQEYIEREEERLRLEREESYRKWKEDEQTKRLYRFNSGADCGWTELDKSGSFYCRRNGRAFRASRDKDKRWTLLRVKGASDEGEVLGTYKGRREASAAIEKIAFAPE